MGPATSRIFSSPYSCFTSAKANSNAVPGPLRRERGSVSGASCRTGGAAMQCCSYCCRCSQHMWDQSQANWVVRYLSPRPTCWSRACRPQQPAAPQPPAVGGEHTAQRFSVGPCRDCQPSAASWWPSQQRCAALQGAVPWPKDCPPARGATTAARQPRQACRAAQHSTAQHSTPPQQQQKLTPGWRACRKRRGGPWRACPPGRLQDKWQANLRSLQRALCGWCSCEAPALLHSCMQSCRPLPATPCPCNSATAGSPRQG